MHTPTQLFKCSGAPLLEGLLNPLDTRIHLHRIRSEHFTALRGRILRHPLGTPERTWLHNFFVTRALTNCLLPLFWERSRHLSVQMRLSKWAGSSAPYSPIMWDHSALCSYENRLNPQNDSACRLCGNNQNTLSKKIFSMIDPSSLGKGEWATLEQPMRLLRKALNSAVVPPKISN